MEQSKNPQGTDPQTAEAQASGKQASDKRNGNAVPTKNLLDTMSAAGKFTSFIAGMKSAGLTDRLSGTTSYTVFAPTDEAFKKLAPGALDAVMKDTAKFKSVLNYHVVSGHIEAKHVKAGDLMTQQGSALKVETAPQEVRVNGARVTQTDLVASNGVVHAIDTIVLPTNWQLLAAA